LKKVRRREAAALQQDALTVGNAFHRDICTHMTLAYNNTPSVTTQRAMAPEASGDRYSVDHDRLPIARTIEALTKRRWGATKRVVIIGKHDRLSEALERAERFAASPSSILLTGETGTGKELFARGLYVMSPRAEKPFLAVNCAQYADSQLMASELFGHRRGSFTGAVADHRGVFEEANGGTVFLDEIGELSLGAQAMMLRALGEGEIVAVGDTRARHVDVKVIAATSRDLLPMVQSGRFRPDLYYRLRCLHIHVPSVRDRGDDWRLLVAHALRSLADDGHPMKRLADESLQVLRDYGWPGNVRQLKAMVDLAFHMCPTDVIHPCHFAHELEQQARDEQLSHVPIGSNARSLLEEMITGEHSFWDIVHRPYMDREINRQQVREIVALGLDHARGSYRRMLGFFGIAQSDYLKFMDFLRHQRLKPQ
jgi:transcriptional regulator with PAS, ATPase and Fis domain